MNNHKAALFTKARHNCNQYLITLHRLITDTKQKKIT